MSGRRAERCLLVLDDEESGSRPKSRRLSIEASTSRESQTVTHSSDEQNSNDEEDDSESLDCRLRHGLIEDCLCKIFEYLDVYDLIQLCSLDIYYQNLISKWIIARKLIDFTELERNIGAGWTRAKFFEVFGKTMRRIKISEENTSRSFKRFLNLIIQHCSVGHLTEVELNFSYPESNRAIIGDAMPYFSNLRKLVLNDCVKKESYKDFLLGISTVATNLTHLTLQDVDVEGEWLLAGGMENLKELRLHKSEKRSIWIQTNELSEFLRTKAKLELFSYIGNQDIKPVFATLSEHCPQLKTFADISSYNPHSRYLTEINDQMMMQRYNFVRRFADLTSIGVTSYTRCGSDLYSTLLNMANENKVQELKIFINLDKAIILPVANRMHYGDRAFANFRSLKTVELRIRSEALVRCDLDAEFISEFLAKFILNLNLLSVEKVRVTCKYAIRCIKKIFEMAPNINELDIAQTELKYLPVEMREIIRYIRKRRAQQIADGQSNPKPLHVVVNERQWRELQVYKDVDTILTTTIQNKDM